MKNPRHHETLRNRIHHLRRNQTDAEHKLWRHLRSRRCAGAKFRRQHPLGPFIVDFFCMHAGLVVELDGGQHTTQIPADRRRTAWMAQQGYRVLRFWNDDVFDNLDAVLATISEALKNPQSDPQSGPHPGPHPNPHPNPLPEGEGAKEGERVKEGEGGREGGKPHPHV